MEHEGSEHRQLPGRALVNLESVIDAGGEQITTREMAELRPSLDLLCVYHDATSGAATSEQILVYSAKENPGDDVILSLLADRQRYVRLSGWVLADLVVEAGLHLVIFPHSLSSKHGA
jgi:hypothetical protein